MIFDKVDIYDLNDVLEYLKLYYPKSIGSLKNFSLSDAAGIEKILTEIMKKGEQVTFHSFPGLHIRGNGYIHPRFIRVTAIGDGRFRVIREKSLKERAPVIMSADDIVEYYFELAEMSMIQAESELDWNDRWPPEDTGGHRR